MSLLCSHSSAISDLKPSLGNEQPIRALHFSLASLVCSWVHYYFPHANLPCDRIDVQSYDFENLSYWWHRWQYGCVCSNHLFVLNLC